MRQVVDTMVWLAMILVVAAVVYFTPRLANYMTSMAGEHDGECTTCSAIAYHIDSFAATQTR